MEANSNAISMVNVTMVGNDGSYECIYMCIFVGIVLEFN